jgi:hypothetical protein
MMTQSYHDHEADALPQARGTFDRHGAAGPVLVQVSKSGPAFDAHVFTQRGGGLPTLDVATDLVVDLARSLQAQALQAVGEVLTYAGVVASKGEAKDLKTLLTAWAKLLQAVKPDIHITDISRVSWMTRQAAARDIQTVVLSALRHCGDVNDYSWQTADMIVRAAAEREVTSLNEALSRGVWEDDSHFTPEMVEMLTAERDWFRVHADGLAS